MAITYIASSYGEVHNSANAGTASAAVTIPAGTTLFVLAVIGYNATTNYIGAAVPTVGGEALTLAKKMGDDGDKNKVAIFYKVSPTAGASKDLVWDWAGTGAWGDGGHYEWASFEGAVAATPVGDSDGAEHVSGQSSTVTLACPSMIAASGDLVFGAGYVYDGIRPTSSTMSPLTQLDGDEYNNSWGCFGYLHATGNSGFTVDPSGNSGNGLYITVAGVVFTAAAAGGSSHPYTGGVGVGAITRGGATQRVRGIVRSFGSSKVFDAGTVKARGKSPTIGGGYSLNSATVRARGKSPASGGTRVFSAGSTYSNVTLYLYTGGGAQVYDSGTVKSRGKYPPVGGAQAYSSETVKSRGKSPSVGGEQVYGAASVYSKATLYVYSGAGSQVYSAESVYSKLTGATGTQYSYIGNGVLVFDGGSTHSLGKVYVGGGAFHFDAGSVYSKATIAASHSYVGLQDGAIVFSGGSLYLFGKYVSPIESLPVTVWTLEGKPSGGYTLESIPQRPAAQDGAYTDPTQDGIWDEYPVDGAYTKIGYEPEMKPMRRATPNMEGKPTPTSTLEGKPN